MRRTGTCSPRSSRRCSPRVYLEHGFEPIAGAIVEAFAEPDRVRADPPRRPQDRAAGGAGPSRARGQLHAARRRRARRTSRTFTAAAIVDGQEAGVGRGSSKKGAEQQAAREALERPRRRGRASVARDSLRSRVHLKAIKLRGFKSFVDPVEVRLEPGVAVVVGPNGSGKSNISDSILWASGSLSPHELRAEKPDDVLFVGSAGRRPVEFCEVELIFDNEDGAWPEPRLLRGLARAAAASRRRGSVPDQPCRCAAPRPGRASVRRRARRRLALGDLAGKRRVGARREAVRAAGARRGGRRPRPLQAPPPSRRAEARARRRAGRARPRHRGRGEEATAPACASGDGGRARDQAARRDRRPAGCDRLLGSGWAVRAASRGRRTPRARRPSAQTARGRARSARSQSARRSRRS